MKNVIVIIPVYYNIFSNLEKISLRQSLKVLKNYDKCFVIPDSLAVDNDLIQNDVSIVKVERRYMDSIDHYSEMLCSEWFYEMFNNYEFMLIAQIDTFIFSDKIDYFCKQNYDYIGAPWPSKARAYVGTEAYLADVGNGGLSLRNINSHIRKLREGIKRKKGIPEDVFWAVNNSPTYKVAPVEIASLFSLEGGAEVYYKINKNILPMGCHAWWRVNYHFWRNIIEKIGYELPEINEVAYRKVNGFEGYSYLKLSKEKLSRIILKYTSINDDICIWGAGVYGEDMGWLLNCTGIKNYVYIDKMRKGEVFGKKIFEPDYIFNKKNANNVVIIANKYNCDEIEAELLQNNYEGKIIRYSDILLSLNSTVYQK